MRASCVVSHSDRCLSGAEIVGESALKAFAPMMKPRAICAIV